MSQSVSIGAMIEKLDGLRDTKDLSPWENEFVTSVLNKYLLAKKDTRHLSEKQVSVIQRIHDKHFA
jgi:hypothetical protein